MARKDFEYTNILNGYDFCLPKAVSEIPGTFDIIPKIKEILERFGEYEFPIIHLNLSHKATELWRAKCHQSLFF